ncbi:anthranilate synthase component I family protein [Acinetobacter rathckeae]|uniref:anthranilate synthase component I family protein n=1 Tax=Acinetobacter rathckeae TaxID=2605272 RepID=UPI0018A322BA|nr:anthranilate synthase component I family protein [Acinetobacter rathckeae]MBF7688901.1 anthranilate synthase component I family protein [Acinetobacter rathckeae]MBF7696694.1 anthranilate synthase component I family protein [Acinetobacter rathckeae]
MTPVYKQAITSCPAATADLLAQLSPLHGLIYLEDHGKPVIGLLPKQYWQAQHGKMHVYTRQAGWNYSQQPSNQQHLLEHTRPQKIVTSISEHGFHGGWIGFVGYDYAAQQYITSPSCPQPELYLGLYLSYLKYEQQQWFFYSHEPEAAKIFQKINQQLTTKASLQTFQLNNLCQAKWERSKYNQAFQQVIDYIKAGDCYQINLTQAFTAHAQGDLLSTAKAFWTLTNAPYAGYLRLKNFELLSCSPELFIEFEANRVIKTRPIKGTMPRYLHDPQKDEQSKNTLKHSEKDQAENVMIVDLLRNDLSIYAETGSVKTNQLFDIESFQQVHHMVSEVQATLKTQTHPLQMLFDALPGGSITGAPKIRAMQIIAELEQQARGAYCGSLGYFNLDGTGCWNILIRSIQKYEHELSLWAGGGITIASKQDAEYQECLDKILAMQNLLNSYYSVA